MNLRGIINYLGVFVSILLYVGVTAEAKAPQQTGSSSNALASVSSSQTGETHTLLPDGRLLIVGGQDNAGKVKEEASIQDANTGITTALGSKLNFARAWHTATVLPNGTVLILGGIGADGTVVSQTELFDPHSETFQLMASGAPGARVFHTATLLTDGRVWIAGGVSPTGESLTTMELWDPRQQKSVTLSAKLNHTRRNHAALLMADGRVLIWGGHDDQSTALTNGELFDPGAQTTAIVADPRVLLKNETSITEVRASSPEDNATDVPLDALISMRFSKPLLMESINDRTAVLQGPEGGVDATIVGAEGGMLAFITPKAPLVAGTTYSVTFSGGTDANRATVAFSQFMFTTAGDRPGDDGWIPTADWMTHRPDSKWQALPPLSAGAGVTALVGQVLKLDGTPLAHVSLIIDGKSALSDGTGRFLLKNITAGHHALKINATTANTGVRAYGIYEVGVDIKAGQTNVLTYTIWMTPLDTAHTVTIPSPTLSETVITSPLLPGLELHLPANTVITDDNGRVVTQINITPIPLDRPPFPLPHVPVPIYFTIQPGSSYISVHSSIGPKGAQLFYPNGFHYPPGTQFNFWNYDADNKGWFVYGQGRVSADASQVIPNPGVVLYEFTGAMVSNPNNGPPKGPAPGDPHGKGGDPVDLATGLFVYSKTDLVLPDIIPISFRRTYRQNDSISRAFGIGTNHPYDMFMVGTNNTTPGGGYLWQDLILPDGGRIHFPRISPCTGANGFCDFSDAVYENTSSPTDFYGATIKWGGCSVGAWMLTKKDGTVYCFPDSDGSSVSQAAAPVAMYDRYGNSLTFVRDGNHNLTQITSPNGRWIKFTYDSSNRIIQAQDNVNRTVTYAYDAGGRLSQVTDANGGVTNYTYDAFNEMLTVQDARGIFFLTNQYDSSGRVATQTQADKSVFQFVYTTDPITGNITQTDMTDPLGNTRRTTFNANGYTTSVTNALGKPEQQTFTYLIDPNTNLSSGTIDPLGRQTAYTYDALGNMQSVTTMAGTTAAATTQFTYDPNFNQLASVTDPLNHTTTYQRDPATGNLTSVTDSLGHQTTYKYFPNGQLMSATDAMGDTVQFGYDGDLASITDPQLNMTSIFTDAAGRVVATTDALGNTTKLQFNPLNLVTKMTDAKGNSTISTYDPNGNLLSLADALNHTTSSSYDNMNRLITRTDALYRQKSFTYDLNGNITSSADGKGQVTSLAYDRLNRLKFVGFNTVVSGGVTSYESTKTFTYDAGNRITQVVDSAGGTITRAYDDLNRLITETGPQGSVTSGYDSAGRRTSMTVAGQPQVSYSYDNANRLTQIAQGASTVGLSYDNANRRTLLTLPNGVSVSYGYDSDSRIAGITYQFGATTLGNLTYSYDQLGRRTQIGGSFARTNLPGAVTSATYDAANQLTQWNGVAISYDGNGNMQTDGANTFAWNARNQVAALNGVGLQYDAFGRRIKNAAGTSVLFDGANATQELSGSTVTANLWTGGLDEFFQRTDSNGAVVPLADALGSTIALANSSGSIVTTYAYDPFGNTSVYGQMSANKFQFASRENEGNGLYYMRARYYSPTLGRFISQDPLGFAGGDLNLYGYVGSNPISRTDRLGLSWGPFGGIRGKNQSYKNCMMQHGQDYSMAGAVDLVATDYVTPGYDPGIRNNFVGGLFGGNHVMGLASVFGGDGEEAPVVGTHAAIETTAWGMGNVITYGRRTTDIMSLNINGIPGGPPQALSQASAGAQGILEDLSSVLNLGMSLTVRLAVDVALTGAEAIGCSMQQ